MSNCWTNRARNQLSNTRCTEVPSYHQNSQELQQDPLKHSQMLSRSNRPRQAQCIFNFPRRWQQQDRKRSWRAPERILTIKLTGRREMRSQRSRGALHGRGEEQLRCQYRPRCGERDIKVKRDRRVTRRGEAGLKKESDCGEDVDRNKRWLWRWASVNVATARWTFNGTTGPGVSSGHPATSPFLVQPIPAAGRPSTPTNYSINGHWNTRRCTGPPVRASGLGHSSDPAFQGAARPAPAHPTGGGLLAAG